MADLILAQDEATRRAVRDTTARLLTAA